MQEETGIVIKYDTPIEVSKEQYNLLMSKCRGIVAGRESEDGKCYIKVWAMEYAEIIAEIIKPKSPTPEPVTTLSGKT